MKLVKRILKSSIIIISILIFISTPCFATQTTEDEKIEQKSLTPEQQAYLQAYVRTYVEEGGKKGLFEYSTVHNKYLSYNNKMSSDRKNLVLLCIVLC